MLQCSLFKHCINLFSVVKSELRNHIFIATGVLKNVATEIVLRPQRTPDLLVVMDFSAYESDEVFDYAVG